MVHPAFPHIRQPLLDLIISDLLNIHNLVHENIEIAKEYPKHYYAASHETPTTFKLGDKIMIRTEDLLKRANLSKVTPKQYVGPYKTPEMINPRAYRVDMRPQLLECHAPIVFHISKLRKWDSTCRSDLPYPLIGRDDTNR